MKVQTGTGVSSILRFFALSLGIAALCTAAIAQTRGTFVKTGSMSVPRYGHTATLLPDGRVLIAGGGSQIAEIYDSATGTFVPTGRMIAERKGHTATLLKDGTVLLAGGSALPTAELYDPATGSFTATGNLIEDQFGQAAVLLDSGKVLLVGGERSARPWPTTAGPELFDPATGTFALAGAYAENGTLYVSGGPVWPTASVLRDGRVLIAGENPPEIFDPVKQTFSVTGKMIEPEYRYGMDWHAASSLADGTVLITGGSDDLNCDPFATAEIYDPQSDTFSVVGPMTAMRDIHTATLLKDNTVLLAGGGAGWCSTSTTASAELYEPTTRSFVAVGSMTHSRAGHTATLLNDGTVLIAGGFSYWPATTLQSAELYFPSSEQRRRAAHH